MSRTAHFVVDASVAVKWVVPEQGWQPAIFLLQRALQGGVDLIAPETYAGELANALWKKAVLLDVLTHEEVRLALGDALAAPVDLFEARPLVEQAFELALNFRHSMYDSIYVALALQEHATLVTADARLARTFGVATGAVRLLADLPSST